MCRGIIGSRRGEMDTRVGVARSFLHLCARSRGPRRRLHSYHTFTCVLSSRASARGQCVCICAAVVYSCVHARTGLCAPVCVCAHVVNPVTAVRRRAASFCVQRALTCVLSLSLYLLDFPGVLRRRLPQGDFPKELPPRLLLLQSPGLLHLPGEQAPGEKEKSPR